MSVTTGSVVVVDVDELGRVHGLGAGLGDHEGHRVADVAHLVDGQGSARALVVDVGERPQGARSQVVGGEDGEHAGSLRGLEVSIPVIRACANGLRTNTACATPSHPHVVHERPLADQELTVFDTAYFGPQQRSRHDVHPSDAPLEPKHCRPVTDESGGCRWSPLLGRT